MLLSSTDLVRYVLHYSKSWVLPHMTYGTMYFVSLAKLFSFESSSNWTASALNRLSLLLKLFLSLSFLSMCWSTASWEHNGSLTSPVSLSKIWWSLQDLVLLAGFSVWTVPFCSIYCQLALIVLKSKYRANQG